mgnify:CR=1 FL=1
MSVARGECVKNFASNSAPPSRETENLWYLVRSRDLPYGTKLSGLRGAQGMTQDEARGFYAATLNVETPPFRDISFGNTQPDRG